MILPGPDTVMTFAQAQEAMATMARAFDSAINSEIKDEELRMRVHGAVAKNILDAVMAKVDKEQREAVRKVKLSAVTSKLSGESDG